MDSKHTAASGGFGPPVHLLIRHAESEANAGLATSDPASIPLTKGGHAAALRLAEGYAGRSPERIVVSPYLRARQTAAPFIERFASSPVETWDIHEFTYISPDRCAGSTAEKRLPLVLSYWENAAADHIDGTGAESFSAFLERVRRCITQLETLPGPALVFTHEMVMKAVLWMASEPVDLTPQAFRRFSLRFAIPNLGSIQWHSR